MRPGQNKRMRGRPNNNRRGPNPLTRSYEFKRAGREDSRQRPSRRGEISAARARRPHQRRPGRGGELSSARRTLFSSDRFGSGGPVAAAERRRAPAGRERGRRHGRRRRWRRIVRPLRLARRTRAARPISRSPPFPRRSSRNPSPSASPIRIGRPTRAIASRSPIAVIRVAPTGRTTRPPDRGPRDNGCDRKRMSEFSAKRLRN